MNAPVSCEAHYSINPLILVLESSPEFVVWIYDTFDNNFEIENDFTNISTRVAVNVLIDISPSNISQ